MTNPILQLVILFFLLIIIHIYFLISLLLKKGKQEKPNNNYILLILFGIAVISITFGLFYNEFLTQNKPLSSKDLQNGITNWGYFGSYFGGFVAPILTFITLIILIKQIQISREANIIQIEHLNKTRRIEILTNNINSFSKEANLEIEKLYPLTEELVKIFIDDFNKKDKTNFCFESFTNNYKEYYANVKYSDETIDQVEWQNAILYLKMLNSKYGSKITKNIDEPLKINCHNISVSIKKVIALCSELSNIDEHSYQNIKFSLTPFVETVEELRKVNLINKQSYMLFFKLISIHNNNSDSIEDDLKKIFSKELSNKYNLSLCEKDLSDIQFGFHPIDTYKSSFFLVDVNETTYGRINGEWKSGEEIKNLLDKTKFVLNMETTNNN